MIGLDTNVLVRYFAQDDAVQSKKATVLMESLSAERPGCAFCCCEVTDFEAFGVPVSVAVRCAAPSFQALQAV